MSTNEYLSDSEDSYNPKKREFDPYRVIDHSCRLKMGFNGSQVRVFNNKIYKKKNYDSKWRSVYSFEGVKYVLRAVNLKNYSDVKDKEKIQAHLIATTDSKYISNFYFEIIEFSLAEGYSIIGYCMKWTNSGNDAFETCLIVKEHSTDYMYFVYKPYDVSTFKCVKIDYDFDSECYSDSDSESKFETLLDFDISTKCRQNIKKYKFCLCYNCIDGQTYNGCLSTYMKLHELEENIEGVKDAHFIKDAKVVVDINHFH